MFVDLGVAVVKHPHGNYDQFICNLTPPTQPKNEQVVTRLDQTTSPASSLSRVRWVL